MRKKFTMLFAALLACVGVAKAQNVVTSTAEDPVYYTIASYNRGGVITYSEVGGAIVHDNYNTNGNSTWYFEAVEGNENNGVYIVNKNKSGESKLYIGSDKTVSTTPAVWYILPNGVNDYGYSISSSTTVSTYHSCLDASQGDTSIGGWQPASDDWNGTTWLFLGDVQNATYNPNGFTMQEGTGGRKISSITVNGVAKNTANSNLMYVDHTKNIEFVVFPEHEVAISIERTGNWMHAYAYVDADKNGFTAEDAVTYSYYDGKDSEGTAISNNNTIVMPNFTAPSAPGTYRMRVKYDWDDLEPNGTDGKINSAGGQFVDVTLVVSGATALTVNYSFTYNGVEKYTQSTSVEVGAELPAITVEFPYGLTATQPEGNANEEDAIDGVITKVIALENTLPFEPAAEYDDENMTWYYLKFHSDNGYYLHHDADQDYIDLNSKAVDKSNKDAYTWAFVGDVFEGFKIVNRATGNGYILSSAAPVKDGDETGQSTWPIMTEEANLTDGNNTYWIPTSSSHIANGFFLEQKGNSQARMNARNGKLAYWTDGAGSGSTFWVEERPMGAAAELTALVEEIEAMGVVGGENIGDYTVASVTALNDAVTAAKAVETATAEHVATLQAAYDALSINLPEEGKFYTITNQATDRSGKTALTIEANGGLKGVDATAMDGVFQFVNAGDNAFYLYSVERGTYLSTAEGHGTQAQNFALATETSAAKSVALSRLADGVVGITPNGGAMLHVESWYGSVVGWNETAATKASAWVISEAAYDLSHTLTVGEAGWSTIVLGYNTTIPTAEGFTAYTIASQENGYVRLEGATGVLGANVPVLVNATAGDYKFTYTKGAATVTASGLAGTLYNKNIAEDAYVLAAPNGVESVGLYKATKDQAGGTAFLNNANKAYYVPTTGEAPAMFSFGRGGDDAEDTTEIESTVNGQQTTVIYDLAGRRVEKMEKGIYIVNGKKVIK